MIVASQPATILVVDDDQSLVHLIECALQQEGFATASASSCAEALAWLADRQPALLLLDLKLLDGEGSAVIDGLRARRQNVPFVVITGQDDATVAVGMMKLGALDYLAKGVSFMEFLPTVVRRAFAQLEDQERLAAAERVAKESQAMTQAVLDSLTAHIAVLDREGNIVALNQPWIQFAEANAACSSVRPGIGVNCLDLGRDAVAGNQLHLELIRAGILSVLNLSERQCSVEYPCHSANQERWFMMTVSSLTGAAGGAVVAHIDITERLRLESEVLRIAAAERQRVAADLHDGVCQELAGIGFNAAALHREMDRANHALADRFGKVELAIAAAALNTREVARGLIPVVSDGNGLMNALEMLTASTARTHEIECQFECPHPVVVEDPTVANEIYRIAQEALHNAVRHGHARKVAVSLAEDGREVRLSVEDDGCGLPVDVANTSGMGLQVMRYRARWIQGWITILPGERSGTQVVCRVPISVVL